MRIFPIPFRKIRSNAAVYRSPLLLRLLLEQEEHGWVIFLTERERYQEVSECQKLRGALWERQGESNEAVAAVS